MEKLEGWKLEYAKRMKRTPNLQYMLLEFVMIAMGLSGQKDVKEAREIIDEL